MNHKMDPVTRTFTLDIKVASLVGRVDPRLWGYIRCWGPGGMNHLPPVSAEPRRDHCDQPGSAGQGRFLLKLLPPPRAHQVPYWEAPGMEGGREGGRVSLVSIPPNFLCLSLGTWRIEASYQSASKQKFKTAFDVKEYGEQGVRGGGAGHARNRAGDSKEALRHTCCVPGPELGAGEQGHVYQPLGHVCQSHQGWSKTGRGKGGW